jgi:hypothetical protein
MTEIFYNVSLNGKHVFRTDKVSSLLDVTRIEAAMLALVHAGYEVERYEAPTQGWTTTKVGR